MRISGVIFLLFFLSCHTALGEQDFRELIGEKGGRVLLSCYERGVNSSNSSDPAGATTPAMTRWTKDGLVVATRNHSQPHSMNHYTIQDDGSLDITPLLTIDEGVYQCESQPNIGTMPQSIQLQVADGPTDLTINVQPSGSLQNGTRYVQKGADVTFHCSSQSYPSQNLTWTFEDESGKEDQRGFTTGTSLEFTIHNLQSADQGNYSCRAQNLVSMREETQNLELLVYYAPERHPNCTWDLGARPEQVHFNCSWYGGFPASELTVCLDSVRAPVPEIISSEITENLGVILNRSQLYEGQNVSCVGKHITGDKNSCFYTLKAPYPTGEPLVAALEGSNVTLWCLETSSLPAARTRWERGTEHAPVPYGTKYLLQQQGPNLGLTVINVTQDDAGLYFCWSENLLMAKELEVYLTVRSSADHSGAVVGVFLSVLIVAAGITLGLLAYSRRERICLSFRFGHLEDRTDVISLVESDEDEVFRDAVPRLPPVVNGHVPTTRSTTLVEIHRIQSSDHEDNIDADQEQEQPDECNGETL